LGDVNELNAIQHVFSNHTHKLNISSTKSMTGHLLGAAGAVESIASILALVNQVVPPTINHQVLDEKIDPRINLTLNKAEKRSILFAQNNAFGFGGHNASIIFKKWEDS
jgi:3-oxoacyl-[acyl-carrier-protein] synthase II